MWSSSLDRTESVHEMQRSLVSKFYECRLDCSSCVYSPTGLECKETLVSQGSLCDQKCFKKESFIYLQYAFLVTASVQFAGGVIVFFGLLTSPKEVGK